MKLRGDYETTDPRLDRLPQFDPRSKGFSIRELIGDRPLRSRGWYLPTVLDQGREGACVGFSLAHELLSVPKKVQADASTAMSIYKDAQRIDEWAGENYSGTSVLAGAKVVTERGYWGGYRWGFSLNDALLALAYEGPVTLGTNWYEGMYEPDAQGYVHVEGDVVGGHAYTLVSVHKNRVVLANSWGADWGRNGRAYLSFTDLERLLGESGECCVPVGRKG